MIFINPLGEIDTVNQHGERTLVVSSCNVARLEQQLGRAATPADFERWFRREARKTLRDERDWRLYNRYQEVIGLGFDEDGHIRTVARNDGGHPRVWLTRYVYVKPGEPDPTPPYPWQVTFVDGPQPGDDPWIEFDATLDVTTMGSGLIFHHAYTLETWVRTQTEEHHDED